MRPFENSQKNAMREAMERVYSWKQEHTEEYSRFSPDMMKVERNDFSCLERIFKMAVGFVPASVLIECQKLFTSNSEVVLSADEKAAAATRVVDELMELKGYLRFGVYTETIGKKSDANLAQTTERGEQFLIREFSLADEDQSEKDDEHIYIPFVTAQEFWDSLPSFIQMAVFTLGKGHSADEMAILSKRIMLSAIQALPEMFIKVCNQIMAGSNSLLIVRCTMSAMTTDCPKVRWHLARLALAPNRLRIFVKASKPSLKALLRPVSRRDSTRKQSGPSSPRVLKIQSCTKR